MINPAELTTPEGRQMLEFLETVPSENILFLKTQQAVVFLPVHMEFSQVLFELLYLEQDYRYL
jgi:hypothetical protein